MATSSAEFPDAWRRVPERLRTEAEAQFTVGEGPVAWFEPDLDAAGRFAQRLVVLSERRILSVEPASPEAVLGKGTVSFSSNENWDSPPLGCRSWPLAASLALQTEEMGGAGSLDLLGPEGRIARWRYTAARTAAAHRLTCRFRAVQGGQPGDEEEGAATEAVCPSCGAPIGAQEGFCLACSQAPLARPARSLLRLLHFTRHRRGMALLGLLLTVATTAAGMVPPYLTKPIFDNVLIPYQREGMARFSLIPWYLGALAAASLLTWGLSWAATYVVAWVSERIAADLRNTTYAHLQHLSLQYFGGKRTGDLISRVSTDTDRLCYFLSVYLLDFANDVLMVAMTAVVLAAIDPYLAVATLLPLPLIVYLVHRVRARLRGGFHLGSRAWAEMTSVLADAIPGIRVVKAFAQEQREIDRFRRANDRVLAANDRVNRLWSAFGPIIVLLTDMGLLVVWVFGIWRVCQGAVTVGELAMFLAYIGRFYGRLDSMSRMVAATQRTAASAQRVFGILDREATVREPVHPVHPGRLSGRIEFRSVGFRYGNRPILQDVNLAIEPGEMIGLVGPSGAGKTTLVNLACRFYDVTEGAILADETDVRSLSIAEYRRHIGLVLQEPFLFYGTIAENIAYGKPLATAAEVIAAARAARAHEFILRLADGYDALVGERGHSLSGGERQRISIARAILIDPRILILDEATSSVDTETEREIQLALDNLIRGRTTIAIAHRLSTLRRADRLVVIERGRITEVGLHEQLLASGGTYARLHRAQAEIPARRTP